MIAHEEARKLVREGRMLEAEQAYATILAAAPDDVEALTALGTSALRVGAAQRAKMLFTRAAMINPIDPVVHHNTGLACEALGDFESAAKSHAQAIRFKPGYAIARLHLGSLLQRAGDLPQAFAHLARALADAQKEGRWLNRATTPQRLLALVENAARFVREHRRVMLFALLDPVAAEHGRDSLKRVEHCLRIYLGEQAAVYPDPRQQPTFLFFPGLPAAPYFDRDALPWIEELESRTAEIRAELQQRLAEPEGSERVFTTEALEKQNLRGDNRAPSWTGYYFHRHGEPRPINQRACPATAAALDRLPLARIEGHAPEVLFSVFTPGTHLLPHRGVTNTRCVGHLPLVVPENCAMNVGGELHRWKEGRVVVFDDTYDHEAWNRSGSTRVVLIFDLWNPHLTLPEREAVRRIVEVIGEQRESVEQLA